MLVQHLLLLLVEPRLHHNGSISQVRWEATQVVEALLLLLGHRDCVHLAVALNHDRRALPRFLPLGRVDDDLLGPRATTRRCELRVLLVAVAQSVVRTASLEHLV